MQPRHLFALGFTLAACSPAFAQEPLPACETQQEIEQVIQSDGSLEPEGCWNLTITAVQAQVGELCVLEFEPKDAGVLSTLREAAVPTRWWVECAKLTNR